MILLRGGLVTWDLMIGLRGSEFAIHYFLILMSEVTILEVQRQGLTNGDQSIADFKCFRSRM